MTAGTVFVLGAVVAIAGVFMHAVAIAVEPRSAGFGGSVREFANLFAFSGAVCMACSFFMGLSWPS